MTDDIPDLDPETTVYLRTAWDYSASYHKNKDCAVLEKYSDEPRHLEVGTIRSHHDACQHWDCWGDRPDGENKTPCPICGADIDGNLPPHIVQCVDDDAEVRADE